MAADPPSLASCLHSARWQALLAGAFESEGFARLESFLREETATGAQVLPVRERIFAALDHVEPEDVRVVILGQDPYPTPGDANGLAFSYTGGRGRLPGSLRNILREVEEDLGFTMPGVSGDLTPWARQGVLLLNTVLTVRAGEAGSHRRRGWEPITDAVLRAVAARAEPAAFLLWGNDARKRKALIRPPHAVFEAGHPSPLSIRFFRGCRPFSRAHAFLGDRAPDWRLPDATGSRTG